MTSYTPTYPASVVNFGPNKQNNVDIIDAADPNTLRVEVVAIETTLGATPSISTSPTASSSWYNDGRDFSTVIARLANIEAGIVADTHSQYVKVAGGSTISPTASTVGITITAASGQTADLMQWKNSSGTVMTRIGPDGILYATNPQLGATDYTENLLLGGM